MKATTVGARIRDARKRAKLTQVQLAKRARIEQSTLSKIERGANAPRSTTIASIAKACGCTADKLLFGTRGAA